MQKKIKKTVSLSLVAACALLTANCSVADRLSQIGQTPALSPIEDPRAQPGYKPVQMPMPNPEPAMYAPNSLWRAGARTFFKDQRARQIGDILTVKVRFSDKATIDNQTTKSRTGSDEAGITNLMGYETALIEKILPADADSANLLKAGSTSSHKGAGSVRRSEELTTNIAAVVMQVLPNGNLVIEGKQEVRVNFEIRELIVAGIVRPEDIDADNMIESTKIAHARIAYGGRGQITDVQQPRYGAQVMDVLLPF